MLDEILHSLSYVQVGFILCIAYFLYAFRCRQTEENKIQKLGGRTVRRKGWVPYGLDLLYEALASAAKNEVLEFWQGTFAKYGNPSNPYTIEAGDGPRRIILTAVRKVEVRILICTADPCVL
jgi:hypothetical protein